MTIVREQPFRLSLNAESWSRALEEMVIDKLAFTSDF